MIRIIFLSLALIFTSSAQAQEKEQPLPWLDSVHEGVVDSVSSTAVWFDDFFVLKDFNATQTAAGESRIRLGWEPRSRDFSKFETRFKVRFKLPNLKNRADIVFSDDSDQESDTPLSVLRNQDTPEQNRFSLALRWKSKPDSGFSHRIGAGRRFQLFAKSRYRQAHFLSKQTTLSWETSAYYYSRDRLGADFSWRLSYQKNEKSIIRQNNHFYFRDRENDWLWQHNLQQLKQIDENNALVSGLYIEGSSRPNYQIDEYLISFRWRRNTLRKWLFFEVEPFVMCRRDEDFSPSLGMALRFEGHFL
ncbi:hypothetical protein RS130_02580 [Paraglaciecola aquimarina]|uniref:DUF481 domain-containing protein n=1 Tax=Paraglaciecola aquimarina TaxID=1235557 RepID=A0ABU3SSG1_9ALTE|nr:hypothetical protein [Paraglaciecola aquimarina]MDU0352958.1 hypothetical protein [Paraglaciecola aquimarina]